MVHCKKGWNSSNIVIKCLLDLKILPTISVPIVNYFICLLGFIENWKPKNCQFRKHLANKKYKMLLAALSHTLPLYIVDLIGKLYQWTKTFFTR